MAKFDREQMAAILGKVAPALAVKDLVQIFCCFCFEKGFVHSFDDICSIRFPATFGFSGGIKGELLLGWLNSSRAKEIEIIPGEGQINFKAGRSKHYAPLLPVEDFLFTPPPMKAAEEREIDVKFIEALTKVSISMGRDASQVWRYGVTCLPSGTAYTLFATDDKTISRVIVGKPEEGSKATLLPPRFVDLLLTLAKTDTPKKMLLTPEWVSIKFQSGLVLFSKAVSGASPKKYQNLLSGLDEQTKSRVEIPKGFDRCLSRALLVIKHAKDPHTDLSCDGTRLRFETVSPAGDVKDSLPFEHGKISVKVDPALIEKGLPFCDKIAIIDSCVRMTGAGVSVYICTHAQAGGTEEGTATETE